MPVLRLLLAEGNFMGVQDSNKQRPLHWAARLGNVLAVDFFLSQKGLYFFFFFFLRLFVISHALGAGPLLLRWWCWFLFGRLLCSRRLAVRSNSTAPRMLGPNGV